jgi:hypothetical protein
MFTNWKSKTAHESGRARGEFVELPLPPRDDGARTLFEFRLDEELRVSLSFKLSPEIVRGLFGGKR